MIAEAIERVAREFAADALRVELDFPLIGQGNDEERHAKVIKAADGGKSESSSEIDHRARS